MLGHAIRALILLPIFTAALFGATGGDVMRYVYHPPESALDRRYEYQWEVLRAALERTKDRYGEYVMQPSERMTERRQAYEMRNATGRLTVMYLSPTPEFERDLIPVRIPVDKNLGGYCVFLVRRERLAEFEHVRSLDDLRKYTFGLGLGWVDVDILKHNGLKVVTGSNYEGLFDMVNNRRFDIFLRSAAEVLGEYDGHKDRLTDLAIEPGIVLYYPLPMYFWFPKTAEGRRLADRARDGMMSMVEDGTYDRIFAEYQQKKIDRLDLPHRRIYRIDNPMLGPETPFTDKRLWYVPTTGPTP